MQSKRKNIKYFIEEDLLSKSIEHFPEYPKSPLRFPGGKARAVKQILSLMPSEIPRLVTPFFGGGSIEIAAAHFGYPVIGFDNFQPLVDFWQELIENQRSLVNKVREYFPLDKNKFYELQKTHPKNKLFSAAIFYVLNRSSYSGSTLSGGLSPSHPRFNESSIKYLEDFKCLNLQVHSEDFQTSIDNYPNDFLYIDPPYLTNFALYGKNGDMHKKFNHEILFEIIRNRERWILSYNNCEQIRCLYKDFRIIFPEWKYGISNNKNSRELLILSSDIRTVKEVVNSK
jgi:DNA adenine methylase